jgi:predicted nucleic acid-binding protein
MTSPRDAIRAFVDANVLYSAAIGGGVARLWKCTGVTIVTSEYAVRETWDNLCENVAAPEERQRALDTLAGLVGQSELIEAASSPPLAHTWNLPDPKDVPILLAAIESNCEYLLTGDKACFGKYFGSTLDGVTVLRPGEFLRLREQPPPAE